MRNDMTFTQFRSAVLRKGAFALCLTLLGALAMTIPANADSHIISFEAPGSGAGQGQGTGCFGCTFSINQSGAVVGTYLDTNNVYHGFLRSPDGKFTSFEAPGADTTPNDYNGTLAQSINDFGVIAGFYADATGLTHGFVRSKKGAFTTFNVPGAVNGSWPIYLNDAGAIVGYSLDVNLLFHAFLRHPDGTFSVFVGPDSCTSGIPGGCYGSEAAFVSLFGASVGNFEDNSGNFVGHGLIREPSGKLSTFDAPGAGSGAYQGTGCPGCNFGVNLWGAIAGSFTDANNAWHGFLRSPQGTFTTFEATGSGSGAYQGTGCYSDCPMGLNDFGVITGSYSDSNSVQHGFLRTPDGNFETVDPHGSQGTQPESINDAGMIVGYYIDVNGVYHGFVAVPCNQGGSEKVEAATAATRVSPATATNWVHPAVPGVLNPKPRLIPWYRSVGMQPLK